MRRIIGVALSAFMLVVGFLALSMSPAQAHTESLPHEVDESFVTEGYTCKTGADGKCRQYHRRIRVVDHERDGNTFGATWVTGDGSHHYLYDRDGAGSGGNAFNGSKNIHHFRACEAIHDRAFENGNYVSCTGWRNVNPLWHQVWYA